MGIVFPNLMLHNKTILYNCELLRTHHQRHGLGQGGNGGSGSGTMLTYNYDYGIGVGTAGAGKGGNGSMTTTGANGTAGKVTLYW